MLTHRISYKEKEGYLLAFVTGDKISVKVVIDYWNEVFSECIKRSYCNVILKKKFRNHLSTIEIYEAGKEVASLSRKYKINIALVDSNKENYEKNSFAETVVNNWGGNGHVFSNIEEAEEWLKLGVEF